MVASAIEGAAPNRPAKLFGRRASPKAANMETASPPAMNRNKYSSNGAQPFKLLKAKRLFPYIGSANFLLHRAIIKTLGPLHAEFHQLAAHCQRRRRARRHRNAPRQSREIRLQHQTGSVHAHKIPSRRFDLSPRLGLCSIDQGRRRRSA